MPHHLLIRGSGCASAPRYILDSDASSRTRVPHRRAPSAWAIIHEICLQPIEQECCEPVVCVASENPFLIVAYPASDRSHYHESHACVSVLACQSNLSRLKPVVLGKHERFGCLTQQLRLRREIDHALHIAFGKRVLTQRLLCLNERGMLLSV